MVPFRMLVAALTMTMITAVLPAAPTDAARRDAGGRYIVVLKDTPSGPSAAARGGRPKADAVAKELGQKRGLKVSRVYKAALNGFAAEIPAGAVEEVKRDPRVARVEPDVKLKGQAQTLPTGVDRIGTDANETAAIDGRDTRVDVDVAVLDTGSGPHADLNVAGGKDCTRTTGASFKDDHGHGSHVAGIVGALDNDVGVVGVAPGARIWSVKVLNRSNSGYLSWAICGLDYVTQNAVKIDVANLSLAGAGNAGTSCASSAFRQAICKAVDAGVTVTVAAGNGAADTAGVVPAAFPEAITVSALADFDGQAGGDGAVTCRNDEDDSFANFSNFGASVDLAAPGVCIRSLALSNGYGVRSGTSQAAPHVAGAAALHVAKHGRSNPANVLDALKADRERGQLAGDADGVDEGVVNVGPANEAPTATITAPNANESVSGTATVRIKATDAEDAGRDLTVAYAVDGGRYDAATYDTGSDAFEASWGTTGLADGEHTLTARAVDSAGQETISDPVTVAVANGEPRLAAAETGDAGRGGEDRVAGREASKETGKRGKADPDGGRDDDGKRGTGRGDDRAKKGQERNARDKT